MAKSKTETPALYPVEDLAQERQVPDWELAALRVATGWAEGKQVTGEAFDAAVTKLRTRPQGGGRI
ncbi:MAG: hypothetical protein AB7E47_05815 [Desulfovibrionaceae bacterium]